ncbi:MAG: hypothetical protein MZU95_03915 [Desulfomicrobium escambiense]|nr:hypothetical protein [Desulfomicrobium escambiense]
MSLPGSPNRPAGGRFKELGRTDPPGNTKSEALGFYLSGHPPPATGGPSPVRASSRSPASKSGPPAHDERDRKRPWRA